MHSTLQKFYYRLLTSHFCFNVRSAGDGAYATDGFTPLHCAARYGNKGALEVLTNLPQVDVWACDLQGRTALHVAAEWEQADCCSYLRDIMRIRDKTPVESNERIFSPTKSGRSDSPSVTLPVDPVGENAPTVSFQYQP